MDMSAPEPEIHFAAKKALEAYGHIDVLVNNAGYCLTGPVEELRYAFPSYTLQDRSVLTAAILLLLALPTSSPNFKLTFSAPSPLSNSSSPLSVPKNPDTFLMSPPSPASQVDLPLVPTTPLKLLSTRSLKLSRPKLLPSGSPSELSYQDFSLRIS